MVSQARDGLQCVIRAMAPPSTDGRGDLTGFTRERGSKPLMWREAHDGLQQEREREAQIMKWRRQGKLPLIEELNPNWADLYPALN